MLWKLRISEHWLTIFTQALHRRNVLSSQNQECVQSLSKVVVEEKILHLIVAGHAQATQRQL
jgi:hypothetical protein